MGRDLELEEKERINDIELDGEKGVEFTLIINAIKEAKKGDSSCINFLKNKSGRLAFWLRVCDVDEQWFYEQLVKAKIL
jgi:hypothetical protein